MCGYVYEGDVLPDDYICPVCKHGGCVICQIINPVFRTGNVCPAIKFIFLAAASAHYKRIALPIELAVFFA